MTWTPANKRGRQPSARVIVHLRCYGLLLLFIIAGCSDIGQWRTKDITGLLPPLELKLTTASGETVTTADFRGRAVLLTFGYTSCPDVCPANLFRLAALKKRLPGTLRRRVRILFVSVDPRRDNPEDIRAFTGHFHGNILGVTGSPKQLTTLTRRYRATFSYGDPDRDGFYQVSHPAGIYAFDQKGRARLLFRPDDSVNAMTADLVRLLRQQGTSNAK